MGALESYLIEQHLHASKACMGLGLRLGLGLGLGLRWVLPPTKRQFPSSHDLRVSVSNVERKNIYQNSNPHMILHTYIYMHTISYFTTTQEHVCRP